MAVSTAGNPGSGSSSGGAVTIEKFTPSSSTLGPCEFDTDTNELTIEFQSGSTYIYNRVPRSVWDGLKTAASPGSYWHRYKNQYSYRKA